MNLFIFYVFFGVVFFQFVKQFYNILQTSSAYHEICPVVALVRRRQLEEP